MRNTALMSLIFINFCVLNSIVSYGQSKLVINVGAFDRRWAFCGEPKFSLNHDRPSTSCFKVFSGSQKVNSLLHNDRLLGTRRANSAAPVSPAHTSRAPAASGMLGCEAAAERRTGIPCPPAAARSGRSDRVRRLRRPRPAIIRFLTLKGLHASVVAAELKSAYETEALALLTVKSGASTLWKEDLRYTTTQGVEEPLRTT
jgi:hypothetical protein